VRDGCLRRSRSTSGRSASNSFSYASLVASQRRSAAVAVHRNPAKICHRTDSNTNADRFVSLSVDRNRIGAESRERLLRAMSQDEWRIVESVNKAIEPESRILKAYSAPTPFLRTRLHLPFRCLSSWWGLRAQRSTQLTACTASLPSLLRVGFTRQLGRIMRDDCPRGCEAHAHADKRRPYRLAQYAWLPPLLACAIFFLRKASSPHTRAPMRLCSSPSCRRCASSAAPWGTLPTYLRTYLRTSPSVILCRSALPCGAASDAHAALAQDRRERCNSCHWSSPYCFAVPVRRG
jgi:hypothetical protein